LSHAGSAVLPGSLQDRADTAALSTGLAALRRALAVTTAAACPWSGGDARAGRRPRHCQRTPRRWAPSTSHARLLSGVKRGSAHPAFPGWSHRWPGSA